MKKHSKIELLLTVLVCIVITAALSACSGEEQTVFDPIKLSTTTTAPDTTTAPSTNDTTTTTSPETTTAPVTTTAQTTNQTTTAKDLSKIEPYASIQRGAEHVLLYDASADEILYYTGDASIYPASATKLLTLFYARKILPKDTIFTVGTEINIAPSDSSKANIKVGERYTLTDISAALLLPSGNDAAYTLAVTCGRYIAGDRSLSNLAALEVFMDAVNEFAKQNGLLSTHFVTPDGYHDPNHKTSMSDMLKIALIARTDAVMCELMDMPKYKVTDLDGKRTQVWNNSNYLITQTSEYYYEWATGMKTGFHTPAGACVIASAKKDGRELIVLIFKCDSKTERFVDAKKFLEAGFADQ